MSAITDPLVAAIIMFFVGAAATGLLQPAGHNADEVETKMVFRLLLGPFCLAVLILVLDGVADHLYLIWRLRL